VNAIAVNPSNPSQWFAGTDSGVWISTNAGTNWLPFGTGLPHAYAFDLEIQNTRQRLVVATHGRAAWDVDIMATGANVAWSDSVYLDSDFCIPEGATLTIAAGTKVLVAAADRQNLGIDAARIEVINKGTILAIGGTGTGQGILFTCPTAGAWHGIRMDLTGCQYSNPDSTGMASAYPMSRLENVTIENALYPSELGGTSSVVQGTTPPTATYLGRPRPSPSAGVTEIPFGIAEGEPRDCRLKIYGVDGRLVRVFVEHTVSAGHYRERWDGLDPSGERVAPGVYFVRLEAGEFRSTEKLVRLK
jgi:hypothetical protein